MDWWQLYLLAALCQISCVQIAAGQQQFTVSDSEFEGLMKHCHVKYSNLKQGNFTSHGNGFKRGENYPISQKCGWEIESPEAVADIHLTFHFFDLAFNKRCDKYDYVHIFMKEEGAPAWTRKSTAAGYCGKLREFSVSAKAKRVFVKFNSDLIKEDNGKGFNASFVIKVSQAFPNIRCIGVAGRVPCKRQIEVEEDEVVTIQCWKDGLPNPTVAWKRVVMHDSHLLNDTHQNETYEDIRPDLVKTRISNGSIQFHNIRMSDSGEYLCNATNKLGSQDSHFQLVVRKKCLCPPKINVYWYENPPYTKYWDKEDKVQTEDVTKWYCKKGLRDEEAKRCYKGIMYTVMTDMIEQVCGTCEMGHGRSTLVWDQVSDKLGKKLSDVKNAIVDPDSKYDIFLPIEGGKDDIRYRSSYYFLPMIESPGVAFMIVGDEEGGPAQAIFSSILDGWPILVLTVVMALLSGIIMWMLDTYWNEEQFPRSIHQGVAEGFWWAFVTMTTVGYGDIAPIGVPGRLFAIIWILTGLVIIAIFTSVITTSLTVVSLSSGKRLYGSKVAALTDSSEYRMGVIKNADMQNFTTIFEVEGSMKKREVVGSLIDAYVGAYYKKKLPYRVQNIFVSQKAYGIVLGKRMSKSRIYDELQKWVESNKAAITKRIEDSTETLEEPGGSAAMEASGDLFNPTNPLFLNSIIGTCIILVILVVGGLMFEYGYLRPRHRMIESAKNLEMVESKDVKEMAFRARCLKEVLLGQVGEFYERWNERLKNLAEKHKAEKKLLLSRGKEPAAPRNARTAKWKEQRSPTGSQDELVTMDTTDVDKPNERQLHGDKPPGYSTTVGL